MAALVCVANALVQGQQQQQVEWKAEQIGGAQALIQTVELDGQTIRLSAYLQGSQPVVNVDFGPSPSDDEGPHRQVVINPAQNNGTENFISDNNHYASITCSQAD